MQYATATAGPAQDMIRAAIRQRKAVYAGPPLSDDAAILFLETRLIEGERLDMIDPKEVTAECEAMYKKADKRVAEQHMASWSRLYRREDGGQRSDGGYVPTDDLP